MPVVPVLANDGPAFCSQMREVSTAPQESMYVSNMNIIWCYTYTTISEHTKLTSKMVFKGLGPTLGSGLRYLGQFLMIVLLKSSINEQKLCLLHYSKPMYIMYILTKAKKST